jgi:hypothetical protein
MTQHYDCHTETAPAGRRQPTRSSTMTTQDSKTTDAMPSDATLARADEAMVSKRQIVIAR